jgi:uncharacterized protein (TIGR02145 family)
MPVALWSDTVWVFVDYNNAGKMERLPVSAATASAGTAIKMDGNDKGAWVAGNARSAGSFSATVTLLTVTATATGACAYASNYPPVGEYVSDTEISFIGTPMYDIVLKHENGGTVTVQAGNTFLVPCDYTLQSFTDATTGAPGIMKCIPMTGSIDFSVPSNLSKGITASFVVSSEPTTPNPASVTYRWTAPDFSPATYVGRTYTPTAPAPGTYPVTLIAQSERYCDLAKTKDVEVLDCIVPGVTVNFTAFVPCDVVTGATWTLQDTRESNNVQSYKVKKMADGRIWQVQDMKFGDKCNKTAFTGSTSNQQGKVSAAFPLHYGDCRNNTQSGAGYLYDWAAALNKAGAYKGSSSDVGCSDTDLGASCQGICPSGWHIPTSVEYEALIAKVDFTGFVSQWEGVFGGNYRPEHNALHAQGSEAMYRTSTYYNPNIAISIWGGSSFFRTYVYNNDDWYKSTGMSLRCIMD